MAGSVTLAYVAPTPDTTGADDAGNAGTPSVVKLAASDNNVRPKLSRSQKRAQ